MTSTAGTATPVSTDRHLRRDLAVLFVGQMILLLLFRLALPADVAENEGTDFDFFYRPVAEQLADGHGLQVAPGAPATRYPPGFPVILGTVFVAGDALGLDHDDLIDPLTIVLTALAGVFLHLAARRVFGRRHAWMASALWLVYPLTLWTTKQPNSEVPFLVPLYAAVALLAPLLVTGRATARRLALVGGLVGLATVIRPAGMALIPAVALVVALRVDGSILRRALPALAVVAGFCVPVLAASAWMSAAADGPVFLSDSNDLNVIEGLSFAVDSRTEANELPMPDGLRDFVITTQEQEGRLFRDGTVGDYLGDTVRDEPGTVAQLVGYKAVRSWYGTESFRFEGLLALTQALWVALASAGIVLVARRDDGRRWYAAVAVLLTLSAWAAAIVALSIVRYLVPALGLMAPLAAVAVLAAFERLRQHRRPRPSRSGPGEDEVLRAPRESSQPILETT